MLSNLFKAILRPIYFRWRRQKQSLIRLKSLQKPTFVHIEASFRFPQRVSIGRYCRIGKFCNIDGEGGISIGDGTILAPYVTLISSSHDYEQLMLLPYTQSDKLASISIGCGCWLGWGAMVAPGVVIGDGSVVGMGAVVTKDVAPGAVVVGNPARPVKQRPAEFVNDAVSGDKYYLKAAFSQQCVRAGRNPSQNEQFWIR